MRSRNDLPGSWVTSITSRSESSFVPPVTAERSPPDSRITGADSPVIADSSTEPTPSMISPSAGMTSPGLDDDDVAALQLGRRHLDAPSRSARDAWSCASRAARSPAPCRGPRRSPRRSSRTARSARARPRSRRRTRGCRCGRARARGRRSPVVITLPSSTMNITGFRTCSRGSSFGNESRIAASDELAREDAAAVARPSRASEPVESEVELEHVDAGLAEEAERAAVGVARRSAAARSRAAGAGRRRRAATAAPRWPARCRGRCPEPDVVTASTGMSPIVSPGLYGPLELQDRRGRGRRRSWRGRGSSGRGSRTSSRRRCRRAPSRTGARGSTAALVNSCAASLEPTTLPFARDQAAVRLVLERDLREAGHHAAGRRSRRRPSSTTIATTELTIAAHQCISPSTIGPSVSAGKIISPAVSAITPTSRTTNVGPSVRNVPAEAGTIFFARQRAAERERGEQRHEAAEVERDRAELGREVRRAEAGERAAVVVRLRVVGVERLGEAVDAAGCRSTRARTCVTIEIAVSVSTIVGTKSAPSAANLISRASIFLPEPLRRAPDHQARRRRRRSGCRRTSRRGRSRRRRRSPRRGRG